MLSIIIPTLNEEKYLPELLKSIKTQDLKSYEIIVADNNSVDKTVEIAKKYGCRIKSGGLPGKARNEGAKIARGELLLFLDADVVLPARSVEKFLTEIHKKNLIVASCFLKPSGKNFIFNFLYDIFYNLPIIFLRIFRRPSGMNFMFIKKDIHEKIKGFDERIKFGEDSDYLARAAAFGRFGLLTSPKIFVSMRRFENDGLLRTFLKYFYANIYIFFCGSIKSDIFEYKWGHHFNRRNREEKK